MPRYARLCVGLVVLLFCSGFAANAQLTRDHDYLPLKPPEGMKRDNFHDTRFDAHEFVSDTSGKTTRVEGRKIDICYNSNANISFLEVKRTLEEEAKAGGGKILFEADRDDDPRMTVFFQRDITPVWVEIGTNRGGSSYCLLIIEEKKLHSDVMPSLAPVKLANPDTSPLVGDSTGRTHATVGSTEGLLDATGKPIQAPIAPTLKATGHVQVYINFVTDSAQLQPSSAPVLNELAAMLKGNPELKVDLIGHTDAVGSDAHNQDLSKRRAASVYLWLVQHGITHDRLQSEGRGFLEPIASNETVEGRALNRRVEVKTTG